MPWIIMYSSVVLDNFSMFAGLSPLEKVKLTDSCSCFKSNCLSEIEHFKLIKHCIQHPYETSQMGPACGRGVGDS